MMVGVSQQLGPQLGNQAMMEINKMTHKMQNMQNNMYKIFKDYANKYAEYVK